MDSSPKSPTETHTSQSSLNPFVNRRKLEGLKDRAGAALRAIMPRRKVRVSEGDRPRTAPYSLRPRLSTTGKIAAQRPTTAIIRDAQLIEDQQTDVAVAEVVNLSNAEANVRDKETMQIPRSIFLNLIELAKYDQALTLTEALTSTRVSHLELLKPRIEAVNRNAAEMQHWLRDTRDENAQSSSDPESSYRETDEEIATYDVRMTSMEQYLCEIENQKRLMQSQVNECKEQQHRIQTDVLRTVREEWPELVAGDMNIMFNPDDFPQMPLDPASLVVFEEDYQEFSRVMKGEADFREDYPFAETGDYVDRVVRMRDSKDEYEAAVMTLGDLKDSSEPVSDEEIRQHTEEVEAKKEALSHAIEESRRAGVHVLDDGTEIENVPGGPFWDLKRHGYETIIGVMKEDGEVILFDPGETISQPTQEEIATYHERAQNTARTWLERETLGVDPDEAGPASPRTPATPGFASLMREVEIGETPNRESSGSQMADGTLQAQLAAWKAAQDRNRVQATALVTEHNNSKEDLMEDVSS